MDPNATLTEIKQLLHDGECCDALERVHYLRDWLDADGFPPEGMTKLAALKLCDLLEDACLAPLRD